MVDLLLSLLEDPRLRGLFGFLLCRPMLLPSGTCLLNYSFHAELVAESIKNAFGGSVDRKPKKWRMLLQSVCDLNHLLRARILLATRTNPTMHAARVLPWCLDARVRAY